MCLLSLLTAVLTFVAVPVFLSSSLPISSAAGFPSQNLKSLCSKALEMHSGDVPPVVLTLYYRVLSFWAQNKIVLLSAALHVRLTSSFIHLLSSH